MLPKLGPHMWARYQTNDAHFDVAVVLLSSPVLSFFEQNNYIFLPDKVRQSQLKRTISAHITLRLLRKNLLLIK